MPFADKPFWRAALQDIKQHHRELSDMAPVEGMTPGKAQSLVSRVRFYQKQEKLY